MDKKVTYKEPPDYFDAAMKKRLKEWEKNHPKKADTKKKKKETT